MSSHHIVRDDQEPALIIANGAACSEDLIGQLLEWSPFVVVLDAAADRVIDLGIKIDVILGDFDRNFDPSKYLESQYPLEIIKIENQDTTDLEKAYEFLIERNFPAVNVVWATGRRADHTITNMTSLVKYQEKLKIVLLDDYSKIFQLPKKYQKWYPQNTNISLIPIGKVEGVISNNLQYELYNEELILGYRTGSSNHVVNDGLVKIEHQSGDLIMMECYDN